MNRQKLLQRVMEVTLVTLFLVGCGTPATTPASEAPTTTSTPAPSTATLTPEPPTLTLTSVPPTATPTPSITEFRQAEEFGSWRMKVVNVEQADSINVSRGSYQAAEGRILYLAELELENMADAASTLVVDPQQIEVVDSEGETYMSIGGAPEGIPFDLHIYHVGGSVSMTIQPTSSGPAWTLTATAIDEKTKEWTIELSGKGSAKLTMAFNITSDAQVKELRWPELRPFSLNVTTPATSGITISGLITNLKDAAPFIAEDTYLQLVNFPADGQLSFTTDDQGRLAFDSELAQVSIPHDGVFAFQVESLEPGTYLIAVQLLQYGVTSGAPFLVKEDRLVKVEIPQDANLPLSFDLGKVIILGVED